MTNQISTIKLEDKEILFDLTNLAEQANGAVLVRTGDTVVLVTCVMSQKPNVDQGFFPLIVEYEERFYAAGKILGSRFVRREGKPSDEAVITARLIDRAIRPLFPLNLKREVQVILTCLSWDGQNDPDVPGLLGTSLALLISDIPWEGPVGVVRVGRIEGKFVVNPTYVQREQSDFDLVFAGVKHQGEILINMIEGNAKEASEETCESALQFVKPFIAQLVEFQEQELRTAKKEKILPSKKLENGSLEKEVRDFLENNKLKKALFQGEKQNRMKLVNELKADLLHFVEQKYPGQNNFAFVNDFFEKEIDHLVHEGAFKEGKRVDDRKLDEIRPMEAKVALLPRTHGSGIFIRGQTKTLSILTLGAPGDQKMLEGMEYIGKKRFMHHYNFPPYAPGEIRPLRGPGRREVGHGMLAEKALMPTIPPFEQFPYTIRIVTEVVSSNGSTSMASICSSSLALMDAGVPITRPAAGISMGLMADGKGSYRLLTDIQGPEDHHGDMDFKIAGTVQGITALQLDVKIKGISEQIFSQALFQARTARLQIIKEVLMKVLPAPRAQLSSFAPRVYILQINPEKIGMVIGPGGKTINKIIEECQVQIDIEDSGEIFITADQEQNARKALTIVKNIVREAQVGDLFEGKVKRILEFGAFIEILPGQEGLLHVSRLGLGTRRNVRDVVKIGDMIGVKVAEIDEQGRINLSLQETKTR